MCCLAEPRPWVWWSAGVGVGHAGPWCGRKRPGATTVGWRRPMGREAWGGWPKGALWRRLWWRWVHRMIAAGVGCDAAYEAEARWEGRAPRFRGVCAAYAAIAAVLRFIAWGTLKEAAMRKKTAAEHFVCRHRGVRSLHAAFANRCRSGGFVFVGGPGASLVRRRPSGPARGLLGVCYERQPNIIERAISRLSGEMAPTAPKTQATHRGQNGAGR